MYKYNCNDYFQYLYRSNFNPKIKFYRERDISCCEHKFIRLKSGGWSSCGGFHSSDYEYEDDVVECICCGLTNKYKTLEMELQNKNSFGWKTIETELFDLYIKEHKISFISDIVIDSTHLPLLYRVAKKMFYDGDDLTLVSVMFKLNSLETWDERRRLNSVDDAYCLMERFKNETAKVLQKKK